MATAPVPDEGTVLDAATIVTDPTTRYFLIKSYNNDNIGRSLQYGVWATSQRNEKALTEAYRTSSFVVLVFSVNHSSRFSGFGVMTSEPGQSAHQGKAVFCGPDGTAFPGRLFAVHWVTKYASSVHPEGDRSCEVFFRDTEHIVNAFNEKKPVKIGRDGQEIDPVAGRRLCLLIDSKQPRHSRPAPLLLDAGLPNVEAAAETDQAPPTGGGGTEPPPPASPPSLGQIKALQQLAVVAKYLKRDVKMEDVERDTGEQAATSSSAVVTGAASDAGHPSKPHPIRWNLDWVEKAVLQQPVLSVFPIDLTQFPVCPVRCVAMCRPLLTDTRGLYGGVRRIKVPVGQSGVPGEATAKVVQLRHSTGQCRFQHSLKAFDFLVKNSKTLMRSSCSSCSLDPCHKRKSTNIFILFCPLLLLVYRLLFRIFPLL